MSLNQIFSVLEALTLKFHHNMYKRNKQKTIWQKGIKCSVLEIFVKTMSPLFCYKKKYLQYIGIQKLYSSFDEHRNGTNE